MNQYIAAIKLRTIFADRASAYNNNSFGADDGFMAGLVYSFLEGYNFRDSARFAIACAAISRASSSLNNPTLSADNALSLVPMV